MQQMKIEFLTLHLGWAVPLFKLLADKLFKDLCGRIKDAFKSADAGMMLTCDIIGVDRKNCKI